MHPGGFSRIDSSIHTSRIRTGLTLSHTIEKLDLMEEVRSFNMRRIQLGVLYHIERAIALREGLSKDPCAYRRCTGARI